LVIRLQPEIVSQYWDVVKIALNKSMPPLANGAEESEMTAVLSKLLSGGMQAWLVQDDSREPVGMCVTKVVEDQGTEMRGLLIYAIYGVKPFSIAIMKELINVLEEFGKVNLCERLVFYSNRENVIKLAQVMGFDISTVLGIKEIQC